MYFYYTTKTCELQLILVDLLNKHRHRADRDWETQLVDFGVKRSSIKELPRGQTTYETLQQIIRYMKKHKMIYLCLITNEYHIYRTHLMLDQILSNTDCKVIADIQSAESILMYYDYKIWAPIIANAYQMDSVKEIISKEKQGVKDLKDGIYKF